MQEWLALCGVDLDGDPELVNDSMRRSLIWMVVLNIGAAVLFPIGMGFTAGFIKMFVLDTCSVLDAHGVINHEALRALRGNPSADGLTVADDLNQQFDIVFDFSLVASAVFIANAVFLGVRWWQYRKSPATSTQERI